MIKLFLITYLASIFVNVPCPSHTAGCCVMHYDTVKVERKKIRLFNHVLDSNDVESLCSGLEKCSHKEISEDELNELLKGNENTLGYFMRVK